MSYKTQSHKVVNLDLSDLSIKAKLVIDYEIVQSFLSPLLFFQLVSTETCSIFLFPAVPQRPSARITRSLVRQPIVYLSPIYTSNFSLTSFP